MRDWKLDVFTAVTTRAEGTSAERRWRAPLRGGGPYFPAPHRSSKRPPSLGCVGAVVPAAGPPRARGREHPADGARHHVVDRRARGLAPSRAFFFLCELGVHAPVQLRLPTRLNASPPAPPVPDEKHAREREQELGKAEAQHAGVVGGGCTRGQGSRRRRSAAGRAGPSVRRRTCAGVAQSFTDRSAPTTCALRRRRSRRRPKQPARPARIGSRAAPAGDATSVGRRR